MHFMVMFLIFRFDTINEWCTTLPFKNGLVTQQFLYYNSKSNLTNKRLGNYGMEMPGIANLVASPITSFFIADIEACTSLLLLTSVTKSTNFLLVIPF